MVSSFTSLAQVVTHLGLIFYLEINFYLHPVGLSAATTRRRELFDPPPVLSETTRQMFINQTALDCGAGEISRDPISLTLVRPMTSQVRSVVIIFTVYRPCGKDVILAIENFKKQLMVMFFYLDTK